MIYNPGRNSARFHHGTQNNIQVKTFELFISWTFHLIFSGWGWRQVTETIENETMDKGTEVGGGGDSIMPCLVSPWGVNSLLPQGIPLAGWEATGHPKVFSFLLLSAGDFAPESPLNALLLLCHCYCCCHHQLLLLILTQTSGKELWVQLNRYDYTKNACLPQTSVPAHVSI